MDAMLGIGVLLSLVACAALACTVHNLHQRLIRLEAEHHPTPFSDVVVPPAAVGRLPRGTGAVLFVSASCLACRAILAELRADGDRGAAVPLAIVGEQGLADDYGDLLDVVASSMSAFGVRLTPLLATVRDGRLTGARPVADAASVLASVATAVQGGVDDAL